MKQEHKAYHIIVKGRVQHIGFRFWTECKAIKFNIKGFVKNSKDENMVELEVEGASDRIESFLYSIEHEHPYARIDSFEKTIIEEKGYKDFKIIR